MVGTPFGSQSLAEGTNAVIRVEVVQEGDRLLRPLSASLFAWVFTVITIAAIGPRRYPLPPVHKPKIPATLSTELPF